jgi:hypothetical protein
VHPRPSDAAARQGRQQEGSLMIDIDVRIDIRFRHLVATGLSAQHGKFALDGGEDDETYAMERGTAVHAMLFGTRKVVGYHEGKKRAGKEWEAFQLEHAEKEILTAKEYAKAVRMAEAVSDNPLAMDILYGDRAVHEKTIDWQLLGRSCAGTPDVRAPGYIAELKTSVSAQPERFRWQVLRMHYHAALAWYMQGVALSGLGQPQAAFIVAVESSPPHPVTVHRLTPRTLDIGARLVRLWMERLVGCEASGEWPGYAQSILELDLGDEEDVPLIFGEEVASP